VVALVLGFREGIPFYSPDIHIFSYDFQWLCVAMLATTSVATVKMKYDTAPQQWTKARAAVITLSIPTPDQSMNTVIILAALTSK